MADDTPTDWVKMLSPIWPETVVLGDGCHYTSDAKGRVAVRPYHVVELMQRDGFTLADDSVAAVFVAATQKAEGRGRPVDTDALVKDITKATIKANTPAPPPPPPPPPAPEPEPTPEPAPPIDAAPLEQEAPSLTDAAPLPTEH